MYANIGTPPNACWNTLGRVIKMRLGPESGCMPTEKAAGKMINPANIATKVSMTVSYTHLTLPTILRV